MLVVVATLLIRITDGEVIILVREVCLAVAVDATFKLVALLDVVLA